MSDESAETPFQPDGSAPDQPTEPVAPNEPGGTEAAQPPGASQAAPQGATEQPGDEDDFFPTAGRDYPGFSPGFSVHPSRLPPALRPTRN